MIRTIAALTLKRLFRGRAVWISLFIAALPIAFSAAMRIYARRVPTAGNVVSEAALIMPVMLVLVVLPAMFVASSIGEEIEDRTTTYLWSRPIPRWNMIAGKLLALAPLCAALVVANWMIAIAVGMRTLPSVGSIAGIFAAATVCCCVAAAIGTLVPKHGMPLMITYMLLFDIPVGAMPIALAEASVTHHLRAIGQFYSDSSLEGTPASGAIGLSVLATWWLLVALWRVRRLES